MAQEVHSIRKNQIRALLKGIETGDPASVAVVNPSKYIQHNPQTHEGSEGLAALFKRLSKSEPRVNIVRAFADGDFVFAHTEYDFASQKIGFEVFRFEGALVVEHWDNIQPRKGPNPSGRSMVDGPTESTGADKTQESRSLARSFVEAVLVNKQVDRISQYITEDLIQHDPQLPDGRAAFQAALAPNAYDGKTVDYQRVHRILAEGDFVLCASEGALGGSHTAFYDLFRVEGGKLVEHWNTIEAIAPKSAWKNDNGKF